METIFENEDFIVLNKPHGQLTIPARGSLAAEESAYSLLKKKYGEIYIVHRLDKEASGLVVFAKKPEAHSGLCQLFEKHKVEKKYLAFVWGKVAENKGEINKRLREFSSGRVAVDFDGKDSLTLYNIAEKFPKFTLLDVALITGRRHQIRVHLYSIGHPIVGDPMYGDLKEQKKYPRLMLHSKELAFEYKGEKYSFKSKPDRIFDSNVRNLA